MPATAKAYSTINTVLKYSADGTTFTQLCKIKSHPALGGDPEQIEVTDLEDTMQTFVQGVQALDTMQFTANFTPEAYQAVKALEGDELTFNLVFGDNGAQGTFSWTGQVSVYVNEGEVNAAREMTLTCTPDSEIEFTPAA